MRSNKLIMRIMCLVLAVILLALAFSGIVSMNADAAYDENMQVRVGLIYGSSMTQSIQMTSDYGFSVGIMTDKRTYMKLGEFPGLTSATVLVAKNLTVGSKTVGIYHMQTGDKFTSYAKAYAQVKEIRKAGVLAYVAYVGGTFRVRMGAYASKDAALSSYATFPKGVPASTVVASSGNGTVLYDNGAKRILFECDTTGIHMGTRALQMQSETKTHYTKLSSGNLYDGVMEFANVSGKVRVINVLDIESYALGVCGWEIIPSWPMETLKAFVCTIRTLAAYHYDARHNSAYGFDVCTTSHCQNYKGMTRDYQNFRTALAETTGQIVTYDGKAIMGIYNGTNGGVTEDVRDIWGGNVLYPYLTSVTIPIEVESHPNHPQGVWTNVVDPTTLSKYLQGKSYTGFSKLTSPITALNIKQYSKYSGVYIYELEFVDAAGHTASVKTSSKVRGSLVKYCPSAYFSISYNYPVNIVTGSTKLAGTMNSDDLNILTADGEYTLSDTTPKDLTVLTASGEKQFSTDQYTIQFDGKGNGHGGGISMYGAVDLAKAGYSYDKILSTYFPGVEVTDLGTPRKDIDYADDGVEDGDDTDIGGEMTDEVTPCYELIVTTDALNLRAAASTASAKIKELKKGTVLVCTGKTDGWCRVFLDDRTVGFVYAEYTKAAEAEADSFEAIAVTVTTTDGANLRYEPDANADKYGTVTAGKELYAVGKSTDWYRIITSEGKVVYVTAKAVKEAEQTPPDEPSYGTFTDVNELVTLTEKVNLRKAPTTSADSYGTADKGTVLVRTGIGDMGWSRILTKEGYVAYTKTEYLSTEVSDTDYAECNEQVYTTEQVNAREEPSTTAAIIQVVAKGTELTRTARGKNGWSKVLLSSGKTAYIKSDYLALKDADTGDGGDSGTDEPENAKGVVKVTSHVNYRKGPGTNYEALGQLSSGTLIVRLESGEDGWDKIVSPSGETAYIKSDYLETYTDEYEGFLATSDKVTTTTQVNLRSEPSTDSIIMATVDKGTELARTGISLTGWSRVLTPDGQIAYVSDEYAK